MLMIEKYSFGVGDRFGRQAGAQLQALIRAVQQGVDVVPVWNKSHREHITIGSDPSSVREAADAAVRSLDWERPYHVDADHINLENVDGFIPYSDFYTIDVANAIGEAAADEDVKAFVDRHSELVGELDIPGLVLPLINERGDIELIARKFLLAVQQAAKIYRHIATAKGSAEFITEISMDETDRPQTPRELLIILAAIADHELPVQTIAPKFTGRFNKGVDYEGEIEQFDQEFRDDLAVIAFAIRLYGLPETLKLSVHSGSDKFSIYGPIRNALAESGAGLHLKTAGTTWLEELIGLAEAGGDGLALAKEIYDGALEQMDALCAPYSSVIAIDRAQLPTRADVLEWSSDQFVAALRHDPGCDFYNPHVRQLLHVGYKVAAKMGDRYLEMVDACDDSVARNVTDNLYERHLKPLLID